MISEEREKGRGLERVKCQNQMLENRRYRILIWICKSQFLKHRKLNLFNIYKAEVLLRKSKIGSIYVIEGKCTYICFLGFSDN